MKMVFTNDPGSNGMLHLEERKYIPEGWDVVIADMKAEGDNAEFYKLLEDADVVINSYVYFGKKEIDALKKCKCISFQSTGYNEVDLDYAAEKGIAVASILDYCTQETAENAIATMHLPAARARSYITAPYRRTRSGTAPSCSISSAWRARPWASSASAGSAAMWRASPARGSG